MTRAFIGLALLLLLLLPGTALAHGGHGAVAHAEYLEAGPYKLLVEFSEWPPVAQKSLQIVVVPVDGIAGRDGIMTLATEGHDSKFPLTTYPGVKDAWTVNLRGFPAEGAWQIGIEMTGESGTGAGIVPVQVAPPPAFPQWAG
jgi:hypothetical protein